MISLLLRPLLLLIGLCLLPVFLIRAQPDDDSDLRAFLTPPDNCPAPCFMGIRPGLTTVDEAMTILYEHPWVDTVIRLAEFDRLIVTWAAGSHALVDTDLLGRLRYSNGIIQDISVQTCVPLGHLWMAYGPPARVVRSATSDNRPPGAAYRLWYDDSLPVFAFFLAEGSRMRRFSDLVNVRLTFTYGPTLEGTMLQRFSLRQFGQGSRRGPIRRRSGE
jgi:hypothetical protein